MSITPAFVATLGPGGDSRSVVIGFPWSEQGFCVGQFAVSAHETPTQVIVNQIEARGVSEDEICAGVGTNKGMAGEYLELTEPLGNRIVTRAVDHKRLEVRRP